MVQRFGTSPEIQGQGVVRQANLDPPIFVHLADAYRKEGLLDDAIRICRDGLEAHASCASGRLVLARALFDRGLFQAARSECNRILHIQPAHPEAIQLLTAIPADGDPAGEGIGWKLDPLASPTLAALYAAQGDTAAAEAIYHQLGLPTQSGTENSQDELVREKLLAFREGARRVRREASRRR
jgi:tetratricopeptide (TPR) repeat protein